MQLSDHFTLAELIQSQTASRLGLDNTPPPAVLAALERTAVGLEYIRTLIRAPIIISSGYRSPDVNQVVGGAASSQHIKGEAADITAPAYGTPYQLMTRIVNSNIDYDQCILEYYNHTTGTGWVHVSFSDKPRKQALVIDSMGARVYA
jgi:hypothetical protein